MTESKLMNGAVQAVEHIRTTLGPEDDWMPTILIQTRDGDVVPVGIPPAGGTDLERAVLWQSVIPSMLVEHRAVEAVLVLTAWVAKGGADEPDVRPSENPDRREMLVLTRVTLDEEYQLWAEIRRHKSKPPELEWEDEATDWKLGGPAIAGIRRGLSES